MDWKKANELFDLRVAKNCIFFYAVPGLKHVKRITEYFKLYLLWPRLEFDRWQRVVCSWHRAAP